MIVDAAEKSDFCKWFSKVSNSVKTGLGTYGIEILPFEDPLICSCVNYYSILDEDSPPFFAFFFAYVFIYLLETCFSYLITFYLLFFSSTFFSYFFET